MDPYRSQIQALLSLINKSKTLDQKSEVENLLYNKITDLKRFVLTEVEKLKVIYEEDLLPPLLPYRQCDCLNTDRLLVFEEELKDIEAAIAYLKSIQD